MSALHRSLLVLEGAQPPAGLAEAVERTHLGSSAVSAATFLLSERPALLLVNAGVPWHLAFAAALAPDRRPAVLVIGEGAGVDARIADEWLRAELPEDELRMRLQLAVARARARRVSARRMWVDPLTRLPNRRAVLRAAAREAARSRRNQTPMSLLLLDLDDFKQVNDAQGHWVGDQVLRKVGRALQQCVRGPELAGRIGGDEFALVLAGDARQAQRAAKRVQGRLATVGVQVSVAVASLQPGERLLTLYRRADAQLRAGKARRKFSSLPPSRPLHASPEEAGLQASNGL